MKRSTIIASLIIIGFLNTIQAQINPWPEVKKETKPWTRWWWMGNAVDEKNISALLSNYNKTGFGGVEIAPIYGAIGYESRYLQYLSPDWIKMLNHTVKEAGSLGMGVDLTNGTGWPFGGPQVPAEHAASRLIVQTYKVDAWKSLSEKILIADPRAGVARLQSLTAYNDNGEVVQLIDKVDKDGNLSWKPKTGSWNIYAAFTGKTRQMVKRAAPGGEGFTLNHLSRPALDEYLSRYDKVFANNPPNIRAFYNDSYEVYNADWSSNFFDEFKTLRGYDLRPHIRELVSKDSNSTIARLKSDYRETMSDMLLNNFTIPWTNWAHKYKGISKNQAHGSPGNLLDLYAAVDIPECETFGSSYFPIPGLRRDSADIRNVDPDPIMLKFASSAAHVTGKNLTSSETFTWLTEHFKTSLSQTKPELEQVFLSGVNHTFFHGTTYSPQDIPFPGWLFYASVNFVPANSWWAHLPGLNTYITRVQSVLQAGKSDNELLVYWPIYDVWNNAKGMDMPLKVHDVDVWLHPSEFYKNVKSLQEVGYSLDFVSDALLEKSAVKNGAISTSANASPYKTLIVPKADMMPVATLQKIIDLAKDGATVIIQQLPADVPGLSNLEANRNKLFQLVSGLSFTDAGNGVKQLKTGSGQILLSADVQKALDFKGIVSEKLTATGLKFIRRQVGPEKYYYLVNHTSKTIDTDLPINTRASEVLILDPQSGNSGIASSTQEGDITKVKIQMLPGEAVILKTADKASGIPQWTYLNNGLKPVEVKGEWVLHFTDGGPKVPQDKKLSKLISWTDMGDSSAVAYSGRAEYSITFKMPKLKAAEYILDLGKVHESAHVWVNGQDAGILWSIPFQARIGKYLKKGNNTIKIEVANLMANRIRDMDKKGLQWRKYHEINFVNINYKDFNAAVWQPQPSGLIGPVTITPYKK
ncbi:glycosyl hydrolase [Pedobacter sp. P351]|uniref:glycosyl hydrolase n=1 Tax=Pedobacter superstes TaxID=3133441 RepID=UPI00309562D3